MKNISLKKVALISAAIYTALIGAGMYTSFHINGVPYTNPKMVETLWIFEVVMTLLTVGVIAKFFSWKEVGFGKINKKQALWLIPVLGIAFIMWGNIIHFIMQNTGSITPEQWSLFALVGFTTFLVGFSEELMYRGIVLTAFAKKNKMISALFVSAVAFSLLHSVNILAGPTYAAIGGQLVLTFILGLVFGLLRIKIENIVPLIIFHWLWDFALIGGSVLKIGQLNSSWATTFILFELVFIFTVVPWFICQEKKKNKSLKKV